LIFAFTEQTIRCNYSPLGDPHPQVNNAETRRCYCRSNLEIVLSVSVIDRTIDVYALSSTVPIAILPVSIIDITIYVCVLSMSIFVFTLPISVVDSTIAICVLSFS
jgi:hypothetical protein